MANGARQDGSLAKIALVISAITVVIAAVGVYLSYNQIRDLRQQFELSGAVLTVESSAQLKLNDVDHEPVTLREEQHPILTVREFEIYDVIYVVFKVTNIGRLDTTLLGANLRIDWDTAIKQDDPNVRVLCSSQGGSAVECRKTFAADPPKLLPGQTYFFYFPLKDFRDKLHKLRRGGERASSVPPPTRRNEIDTGLQGEIVATGLRTRSIQFPLGISVNLR